MNANDHHLATVSLDSTAEKYAQTITTGRHTLISDEPTTADGKDAGPSPYGLLLSALASCTAITLRMYADRKGWELGPLHVDIIMSRGDQLERVERTIKFGLKLSEEQRLKLAEIADKTPITKTLKRGVTIETKLVEPKP